MHTSFILGCPLNIWLAYSIVWFEIDYATIVQLRGPYLFLQPGLFILYQCLQFIFLSPGQRYSLYESACLSSAPWREFALFMPVMGTVRCPLPLKLPVASW